MQIPRTCCRRGRGWWAAGRGPRSGQRDHGASALGADKSLPNRRTSKLRRDKERPPRRRMDEHDAELPMRSAVMRRVIKKFVPRAVRYESSGSAFRVGRRRARSAGRATTCAIIIFNEFDVL
ncbi:hypothetical protein EVAR_19536_1 [Eumeta japonica]|uniref:Uncharacterized protein n=1 Tax=Eumeta variegata TaxID=151549 RepID=A0A4C1UGH3_EUMVA|nr:hypothetical protein EVAR_19536_1 [Eumeta japonica]